MKTYKNEKSPLNKELDEREKYLKLINIFREMSNPFDYDLPMSSVFIKVSFFIKIVKFNIQIVKNSLHLNQNFKYSLIFWNLIMLICGLILTIVGFVAAAEYAQNSGIESLFNHKYISLPVFIGIVGLIVTLICFFGCYGSCKESSGLTIGNDLRIEVISDIRINCVILKFQWKS